MSARERACSPARGFPLNVTDTRVVIEEDATGYFCAISSIVAPENSGASSWRCRFIIRTSRVPGSGAVSTVTAAATTSASCDSCANHPPWWATSLSVTDWFTISAPVASVWKTIE